jgi:hypothetical protein
MRSLFTLSGPIVLAICTRAASTELHRLAHGNKFAASGKGAQGLWTKKMKGRELTGEGTSSTTTRIRAIHFQAASGTRAIGTQSMKTKIGANLIASLFLIVFGNQAVITGSGTRLDSTPGQ